MNGWKNRRGRIGKNVLLTFLKYYTNMKNQRWERYRKMIGVDLTFILDREIEEKRFVSSFSIFVADILDAFKQKGLQDKFCLIVFEWHEEFIRQRFSGFSVCPVKWKPSEWMCVLSKGKYRGRKFVRWFNTYKFSKCACIWFPYACAQRSPQVMPPTLKLIQVTSYLHSSETIYHLFSSFLYL